MKYNVNTSGSISETQAEQASEWRVCKWCVTHWTERRAARPGIREWTWSLRSVWEPTDWRSFHLYSSAPESTHPAPLWRTKTHKTHSGLSYTTHSHTGKSTLCSWEVNNHQFVRKQHLRRTFSVIITELLILFAPFTFHLNGALKYTEKNYSLNLLIF